MVLNEQAQAVAASFKREQHERLAKAAAGKAHIEPLLGREVRRTFDGERFTVIELAKEAFLARPMTAAWRPPGGAWVPYEYAHFFEAV